MLFAVLFLLWIGMAVAGSAWSETENVDPGGWTVIDEGTQDGPSSWFFSDKIVTQSSNIYGGDGTGLGLEKPGTYAISGQNNLTDVRMQADVRSLDDDVLGLMFRYRDSGNYYRFYMDSQRRIRRLEKKINGKVVVLAEDDAAYVPKKWYGVRIEAIGDHIRVYIDDGLVFDVTDAVFDKGNIGLYCWGNAGSEFKNISVNSFETAETMAAGTAKDTAASRAEPDVAAKQDSGDVPLTQERAAAGSGETDLSEEPAALAAEDTLTQGTYLIGPGDVLEISVWKDEALTKLVTVLPDGTISYPLINEVSVGGKTVVQIKKEVEAKIAHFVPGPVLSVVVQQVNSMLIYVIGKVNHPGRFPLNSNIDVLQMLAMAGGLNPFAKKDQIKIFRKTGDATDIFKFNYDEVADGENLQQNILLKRGDVIVVP